MLTWFISRQRRRQAFRHLKISVWKLLVKSLNDFSHFQGKNYVIIWSPEDRQSVKWWEMSSKNHHHLTKRKGKEDGTKLKLSDILWKSKLKSSWVDLMGVYKIQVHQIELKQPWLLVGSSHWYKETIRCCSNFCWWCYYYCCCCCWSGSDWHRPVLKAPQILLEKVSLSLLFHHHFLKNNPQWDHEKQSRSFCWTTFNPWGYFFLSLSRPVKDSILLIVMSFQTVPEERLQVIIIRRLGKF